MKCYPIEVGEWYAIRYKFNNNNNNKRKQGNRPV